MLLLILENYNLLLYFFKKKVLQKTFFIIKMPYLIRKNRNQDTYKVTNKITGELYAKATKNPQKLIQAIEINKRKK
jgi:hypothetical protein